MKRGKLKKMMALIAGFAMVCTVITGCSSGGGASDDAGNKEDSQSSADSEEKETYTIGFTNRLASDVF